MSLLNDKKQMERIWQIGWEHVYSWPLRFNCYKIALKDVHKYDWSVLLVKTDCGYIVTDIIIQDLTLITREVFFENLKDIGDTNYLIYYRQLDQPLVGYFLDCFEYYFELPDKIKTIVDDNAELYNKIRKQKFTLDKKKSDK